MNQIKVIVPYRWEGMWVFDDPAVGLDKEPFVSGADTVIDRLVADVPDAASGFRLVFSGAPFPGHQLALDWVREEYGGNWYTAPAYGMEGWLCPALFKYFERAPAQIFAKAEPRVNSSDAHPALGGSFLALLGGVLAIGFAPIFVRLSEVGPVSTAFWRIAIALPLIWVAEAMAARRPAGGGDSADGVPPPRPRFDRAAAWGMLAAGLFFAADLAVWHWSIHFTSVATSTLLVNFAPVFVALYAWLAFRERITRRFLLAMIVALAGVVLLVGRDFRLDRSALFGDALALITAGFYAGYIVSVKALRGRFSTVSIMAYSGLVMGLVLLPVALVSRETFWPHSGHGWLMVGGLALISHTAGQSLITYALAKLPASIASVILLVQPV